MLLPELIINLKQSQKRAPFGQDITLLHLLHWIKTDVTRRYANFNNFHLYRLQFLNLVGARQGVTSRLTKSMVNLKTIPSETKAYFL